MGRSLITVLAASAALKDRRLKKIPKNYPEYFWKDACLNHTFDVQVFRVDILIPIDVEICQFKKVSSLVGNFLVSLCRNATSLLPSVQSPVLPLDPFFPRKDLIVGKNHSSGLPP